MARRFNGTSDVIVFTLPSTLQAVTAGSTTIVCVANFADGTDGAMVHARTSGGTNSWWMETAANVWNYGSGTTARNVGAQTNGSWAAYIGRKTTGGANAPRGRKIIFGGATTDVTAPSGLVDGAAPGVGGILQVGKWGTASEFLSADVAAVAVFNSDLADATTATFTTWANILAAGPVWAVHFDQAAPTDAITDATGNGGNSSSITGTTIVANPSGFFGGTGATVTPPTVAGVGAVPAPTLSAGSRVTAVAVAGVAAVPAPTLSAGSRVTPAAVAGVASVPAPTLAAGSTVAAVVVAGVASIPAPTLAAGATVAATAVAGVGAVPAPSVSAGGGATVNAATVQAVGAVPAPTLATGATVTPAAVAGAGAVPSPLVSVSTVITVTTVTGTGGVPTPVVTVTGSATVTPATVTGVATVPSPAVSAGGSSPTPVLTHVKDRTPIAHIVAAPLAHERVRTLVHVGSG
jgi:hypothetical protein